MERWLSLLSSLTTFSPKKKICFLRFCWFEQRMQPWPPPFNLAQLASALILFSQLNRDFHESPEHLEGLSSTLVKIRLRSARDALPPHSKIYLRSQKWMVLITQSSSQSNFFFQNDFNLINVAKLAPSTHLFIFTFHFQQKLMTAKNRQFDVSISKLIDRSLLFLNFKKKKKKNHETAVVCR